MAIVKESDLGAPLEVTTQRDSASIASVGAVLGSGEPSAMDAVVGRACVSIGPFLGDADADTAVMQYSSEGMRTTRRKTNEETFVGHWVQIRDIVDSETANEQVKILHAGGLTDAYKVVTEEEGIKISLGLFGNIESAEKIELQARSLELPAEISPRTALKTVYYADIGLPPGKGAGAIIEKYGEDRVRLRNAAVCPK